MPVLEDVQLETLLAGGYGVVLVLIALGLEQAARLVHRRSEQYESAGFRYHAALDTWECPTGEHLILVEVVPHARPFARYRARASACNGCPIKAECTDSATGRVVERALDDWPRSEVAHFYRGISLVLVVLAVFIISVELARNHGETDLLVLGAALGVAMLVGSWQWPAFRAVSSADASGSSGR